MKQLLRDIRSCDICKAHLPLGPRPIIEVSEKSKIIIISQAPGRIVHESGVAWMDQSGKKLREWLGVDETTFYDTNNFAILPMGFCYPGKAKTGDLPPRKECAPQWHDSVVENLKLTSFDDEKIFPEIKKINDKNVTNDKYQKKIKDVKNEKIKKSLIELTKVFKEK